jgi:cytochrome c peroxidase
MRSFAVFILSSMLATAPALAGQPLDPASAAALADFVRPKTVPYPVDNPYSVAKVELGRKLFFDTALSGDGSRSCSTCHAPVSGWQDGLPRHEALDGTRLGRRTPSAQDGAWGELFFWDGRAASLEAQALGPVQSTLEMNQTLDGMVRTLSANPEYARLFATAFPENPRITPETVAKAIATFERTLVSGMTPFDRWVSGDADAMSAPAKHGFELFTGSAGCVSCHSGWQFTDHAFHDIGLPSDDLGRGAILHLPELNHAFKTPTLRNVADRAPYMHDGSIGTLEGVVEHYRSGIVQRPTLSPDLPRIETLSDRDTADLVAFLHALSPDPATAADSLAAAIPATAAATNALTVVQKDKQFSERHVHIKVGQALTIENHDTRAHNIQVFEEKLEFNSGYQEPGEHVSLPFTEEGTYHVFCGIHPKMKLQVDVSRGQWAAGSEPGAVK